MKGERKKKDWQQVQATSGRAGCDLALEEKRSVPQMACGSNGLGRSFPLPKAFLNSS